MVRAVIVRMKEGQTLDGLYVERRILAGTSVSRDIAHHLYARQLPGMVVVVADRPALMVPSVAKLWAVVTRQVQRQRASTLNPQRKHELDSLLRHMQAVQFVITAPDVPSQTTTVLFMTEEQCLEQPPECHTMYVVDAKASPEALTANMPRYSLVVCYETG